MRYLALVAAVLLLLGSCEAYLEEKLEFLELPFAYEGRLRTNTFDPDWDLAWGVPDNGDPEAVYLGTKWGDVYYWKFGEPWYIYYIDDSHRRRIASMAETGRFVYVTDNFGSFDTIGFYDISTGGSGTAGLGYDSGNLLVSGDGSFPLVSNGKITLLIEQWQIILPNTIAYQADILPGGMVSGTDVLAAAFPEADDTWGTPTVDFLAFAPASLASYDGKHKFILARSDGSTGEKKVMLVSVDETDYSLSVRRLSADRSFHFVSRDRFVGMKGDTLKIFNSSGKELADYELEGMRLLGYRASTEPELVFLYRSEEDGDRVFGVYSLPAAFVREAR